MTPKRLLFVDDEPQVLTLVQSMFRHVCPDWECVVTNRGVEALALMASQPFDIVLTDMQMPEMSGVQLLEKVRERYPAITRVVLSGYPDQVLSLRSLGSAHQYFAKPFRVGDLEVIAWRGDQLAAYVPPPELRTALSQLSALPVAPAIWQRLERELVSPAASLDVVASCVAQDPALTLKLLQSVHSAFFGAPKPALLAREAMQRLGTDLLRAMVAGRCLNAPAAAGLDVERLAKHSVATGLHASRILSAERATPDLIKLGFTGGVLHDVGQLALAAAVPEAYADVVRRAMAGEAPLLQLEQTMLGTDHAAAGAYILVLWGMPKPLIDLVAHHHRPAASQTHGVCPLTAVHAANHIQRGLAGWPEGVSGEVDHGYLQGVGVGEGRFRVWVEGGSESVEES
jgi:HD-like signal output (HDOD) protein